MRYVVLDAEDDRQPVEVAGHRGTKLAEFNSEECALALVLFRLAQGNRGVIVVDSASGAIVSSAATEQDDDPGPVSRVRGSADDDRWAAAAAGSFPRNRKR